nr:MAG TPA: hypothetical protein [Caudoviricetes sp.]
MLILVFNSNSAPSSPASNVKVKGSEAKKHSSVKTSVVSHLYYLGTTSCQLVPIV